MYFLPKKEIRNEQFGYSNIRNLFSAWREKEPYVLRVDPSETNLGMTRVQQLKKLYTYSILNSPYCYQNT